MSSLARKIKRNALMKQDRPRAVAPTTERLFAVAIKRGERVWDGGQGGHSALRRALDPGCADPYNTVPGDTDGFIVSPSGRFVDREEAKMIGVASGQCMEMRRELLSSDINW